MISEDRISFFVAGHPEPKGNHRASRRGGCTVLYDANKRLPAWEAAIKSAALSTRPVAPWEGPVQLDVEFYLKRPPTVPPKKRPWPTARSGGDWDKLVRAVGDALAGIFYRDDSQIVIGSVTKKYADGCDVGALVSVRLFGAETP